MLTSEEEKFMVYWAANRNTQRKDFKQFIKGFSKGLIIVVAIGVCMLSGWYTRASMVANSKLSGFTLFIALLGIAVFMAWLYQNYQWETNEQQYLELQAKQQRQPPTPSTPPTGE